MINEIGHIGGRGDSVIDYILDEGEDILYENRGCNRFGLSSIGSLTEGR